jgi:hypothetical protein
MKVHSWRLFALELYVRLHGRRCVLCSKPVVIKEAHIEIRDKEYYLMHSACKAQEKL